MAMNTAGARGARGGVRLLVAAGLASMTLGVLTATAQHARRPFHRSRAAARALHEPEVLSHSQFSQQALSPRPTARRVALRLRSVRQAKRLGPASGVEAYKWNVTSALRPSPL